MNRFASLGLLALSIGACAAPAAAAPFADPPPPRSRTAPMPPPSCTAGVVRDDFLVLERRSIVARPKRSDERPTFRIGSDGAWRFEKTERDKTVIVNQGCLAPRDLASLQRVLASATWRTSRAQFSCLAVPTEQTLYFYRGRFAISQRLCEGMIPDASTQEALAEIARITAPLEVAPQPVGRPPCEVCDGAIE